MKNVIYKITNIKTDQHYVGKTTKTMEQRLQRHIRESIKENSQTHLHRAMRKYGAEHFSIELLEAVSDASKLDEREIHWISTIKPHYNMTSGGEGGDTSNSENYKIGMSKRRSMAGKDNPMYGRTRPDNPRIQALAVKAASKANKRTVMCEGKQFESIHEAQLAYPGINLRKRLDNDKYPDFFRLTPKIRRK